MLKDIIKKEILDHLLSAKFIFMFIICSVLILLSVYIGAGDYLANKKIYDDDVAWDALANQPPNTYSILLGGGLKTYRAPQKLGALVKGVENAAGRMSHVVLTEVGLSESEYEGNPLTAVFGAFDLMFIVQMALSLFVILIIYDAICGEREKGTLKLTLANSVPRDRLLLGKVIGGYVSLCVPLIFPVMISLIYLSLHPQMALAGEDWQRICLIFLMFLLYLTVFFCLGLLVSSLVTRSATSLIVLLFIWSLWGMVVPKASVIVAGWLQPIPVSNEVFAQKNAFSGQASREMSQTLNQKMQELSARLSQEYAASPQADAASRQEMIQALNRELSDLNRELALERDRKVGENNAKIDRDHQLRKNAQAALAKNISRISPASALSFSATTLARTGVDDYNRFVKAAMDYKPVVTAWIQTEPSLRNENGGYKEFDSAVLAGMPRPAIENEKLSRSVTRIMPDIVSMLVMTILLMGGAYFAFIRCDVR